MNRKNNDYKNNKMVVFPKHNHECFFFFEDHFQKFEKDFLRNQLRKRTDYVVTSNEALGLYGMEFLAWFTKNIQGDLTLPGEALAILINSKLMLMQDFRREYDMQEANLLMHRVEKLLK